MASQSAPVVALPGVYPAPPGVEPNYTNPFVLSASGWDDITILCAWLCTVPVCALFLRGLQIGFGAHIWNLVFYHASELTKIFAAASILSVLANGLPKIAILAFYLRINPAQSFRFATWAAIALNAVYIMVFVCLLLFPCRPVKKLWEPSIPGKCRNTTKVYLAGPIGNTILDIIVLLIPIPMIIKLQVHLRTKLLLAAIIFISSCTIIISAIRIWSTFRISGNFDTTWVAVTTSALALTEMNLSIICGSLLVLRPFCKRHFPFLLSINPAQETPGHNGELNFDGPSGPRSKRGYHAKVSSGPGSPGGHNSTKKSGKRSFWNSLGGTLVTKDDDEDLESLSTELAAVGGKNNLHRVGNVNGGHSLGGGDGSGASGDASLSGSVVQDPYPAEAQAQHERGIVKTMTLDVR